MSSLRIQTEVLANYLPPGRAFGARRLDGTVTRLLLEGLAGEMLRSTDLIVEFRDEILPDETILMIEEWESAVGIPDDCFTDTAGSIDERRRNVLAKLVSLGVQTAADFVALAALFGIAATVKGGASHGAFPYDFPMIFFPDSRTAHHTILVDLDQTSSVFPYTFPLTFDSAELALVTCLFNKVKPANVDLLFIDLP